MLLGWSILTTPGMVALFSHMTSWLCWAADFQYQSDTPHQIKAESWVVLVCLAPAHTVHGWMVLQSILTDAQPQRHFCYTVYKSLRRHSILEDAISMWWLCSWRECQLRGKEGSPWQPVSHGTVLWEQRRLPALTTDGVFRRDIWP